MDKYVFRVVKFSEYDFGFFPQFEEETYGLWEKMIMFFPEVESKLKCIYGLMSNIRTVNYDGMLFWSDKISNYVHETENSPETFKFVWDRENSQFIKSPYAREE